MLYLRKYNVRVRVKVEVRKNKVQHIGMHNTYKIMITFINLYLFQG